MAVELAAELLEILACPNCHGGLAVDHDRDELVCTAPDCQLAYPVRDGIPVLLIDEARPPRRSTDLTSPQPADPAAEATSGAATGSASADGPAAGREPEPADRTESAGGSEAADRTGAADGSAVSGGSRPARPDDPTTNA